MAVAKIAPRHNIVDSAAEGAEQLIKSTQSATNDALDGLPDSVFSLRAKGSPAYNRAHGRAHAYADHGVEALHEASQMLRDRALRLSNSTSRYVRDEPVKAMLIAAVAGALTMAFMSLLARARRNAS